MNQAMVDKIAEAVLYEGYNLYPYRPSVKSRCRWTFGGLYPRPYSEAVEGSDAWSMQVQCLLQAGPAASARPLPYETAEKVETDTRSSTEYSVLSAIRCAPARLFQRSFYGEKSTLKVTLRFLHLAQRTIGVLVEPCDELPAGNEPAYRAVDSLLLGGTRYQSWQEAVQREVTIGPLGLDALSSQAHVTSFATPASHALEPLRGPDGRIAAVVVRDQEAIEGAAEVSAERLPEAEQAVSRLTLRVFNRTPLARAATRSRDEALLRTLVAAHTVLAVQNGRFFSLTDPPKVLREATDDCRNLGAWPVLVGAPGNDDAMLASPIILEDYPRIAPESPGDLFDGTEIDEILTLRVLTLSDEEKALAAATDDRTRRLIERTESLPREQLAGLHGAVRSPASATAISVDDVPLRPGDRVRLRPGLGGDIFDLVLNGRVATIESIQQDYEDRFHVAVTLDDDPGQDLGRAGQPGHRFFFKPEELVPLNQPGDNV